MIPDYRIFVKLPQGRLAQQFALYGKGVGCGVFGGGEAAPKNPTFPLFTGTLLPEKDLLHKPRERNWGLRAANCPQKPYIFVSASLPKKDLLRNVPGCISVLFPVAVFAARGEGSFL